MVTHQLQVVRSTAKVRRQNTGCIPNKTDSDGSSRLPSFTSSGGEHLRSSGTDCFYGPDDLPVTQPTSIVKVLKETTRSIGTVDTSAKARLISAAIRIRIPDADRHQNLIVCIVCSLAQCQPSLKISCKSVLKFLCKCANRQTTNNDDYISSFVEVIKKHRPLTSALRTQYQEVSNLTRKHFLEICSKWGELIYFFTFLLK